MFTDDVTATRLPVDDDDSMDGDFVDIDADGDVDMVTANLGPGFGRVPAPYRVGLNVRGGFFVDATADFFPAGIEGDGLDVEAGDFDRDGRLDLYLASRGGADRLLLAGPEAGGARFRRADANGDGSVDIADPSHSLTHLFLEGGALECDDAADSNDDGLIDLADAVYTLNFLFLGGGPPAFPGPVACGADLSADPLQCEISSCEG